MEFNFSHRRDRLIDDHVKRLNVNDMNRFVSFLSSLSLFLIAKLVLFIDIINLALLGIMI